MKSLKITFLIAALLGGITGFTQTADEIADKHIDAIGGKENWRKVKSIITEGVMSLQGMDIAVTTTSVHNKGNRQDLMIMGQQNFVILTPTAGWTYMPVQGQTEVQELPEDAVKKGVDELDAQGALVDYKEKGHSLEYLGKENADGKDLHKLKLTLKGGKVTTYFIDAQSFLLVKSTNEQEFNGMKLEMTTGYGNYQKLPEGISVPMTLTIPLGMDMYADMVLNKVTINKDIPEETFKPGK
ncbi:MAG TPA: hypothetical protein VIK80_14505 [Flavihumibacter sp.]|jgi:hypothetical protein